ncbi:MAG: hypothetical protein O2816_16885 [Planctomycetota bacterium]|nr:hypothetical protein [Planctomycetota bacterium]
MSLQAVGGERCDLRLVGSCTYRLNLVEAGSKRALPRAGLTMIRGEERTPILPANSAVRPQHPLPGIFPGEKLTFELALPGRPPLLVAAPNPRRGEVPWHLSVQPARTLLLDLVDDQGNACADVEVQVTQGTTAGTTGSPYTLNGALIPSVHYEVRSDERGRVTLRGLHATTHTLRVFFGPCLVHEDTLSPDQLDAPQQIQEPQHGVLALDVLLPDHARTAAREGRLKLRVQPLGRRLTSNAGEFDPREPDLRVSLPPGEARVYGCMASQQGTWELAVTEIRAGEITALELDLTETCPGLVDFAVTVNGRDELAGWDGVFLGQVPGQEDEVQRLLSRVPRLHALLTPMQYQATLRADDRAWEVDLRFTLAPGEHFDRKLDFTLHERTLELRDASTGDPLAGGSLTLRRTRFEHTWDQEASIDAEGQASLRLVAGAAELMVDGYAPRTIEVPSGSDPFVVTLDPKESKKLPQSARAPR